MKRRDFLKILGVAPAIAAAPALAKTDKGLSFLDGKTIKYYEEPPSVTGEPMTATEVQRRMREWSESGGKRLAGIQNEAVKFTQSFNDSFEHERLRQKTK